MALRKRLPLRKVSPADTDTSLDEVTYLLIKQVAAEAELLEDAETRELWLDAVQTFSRTGDLSKLLAACEWRRKVVDIDEFMFSSAFLGMDREQIYPSVIDACYQLDTDEYVEAVLKGCIGSGKSTIANIMLARALYKLSCMRHPQTTFGIQSKSSIVFTIQSVRFNTAKKAVFEEFGNYVNNSPYFKSVYRYDPNVASQMIFREQRVSVMPVTSSSTGAISMNVIGGILDEMNFMQKVERSKSFNAEIDGSFDQAKTLYNTLARRRRSRFTRKGNLPGILFVVSSSRFPDDFTEQKASESTMCGGVDPKIFVYSHSQWTAKPRDTFMAEEFRVQVGNERIRSRVLAADEQPSQGCSVISVPMDFHSEFIKDVEGSLRDYAGVTSLATHPFLSRRDAIHECMELGRIYGYDSPFTLEEYDLSIGLPKPDRAKIRTDIDMFRTCHIDLGLKSDAAGVAVGHIAGTKVIERINPETKLREIEILPVVALDVVLRIIPPPSGEIEFAQIRALLVRLRDAYKLDIRYVTFDGYQSVDSRQILKQKGFQTAYLSVEKIEPYRAFRDALYDGRVLLPQNQRLAKELAELEVVVKNGKEKVDHKPSGSKDVADAVCGVTSFLMSRRAAWAGLRITGETGIHLFAKPRPATQEGESPPEAEAAKAERKVGTPRRSIKRRNISRKSLDRAA